MSNMRNGITSTVLEHFYTVIENGHKIQIQMSKNYEKNGIDAWRSGMTMTSMNQLKCFKWKLNKKCKRPYMLAMQHGEIVKNRWENVMTIWTIVWMTSQVMIKKIPSLPLLKNNLKASGAHKKKILLVCFDSYFLIY